MVPPPLPLKDCASQLADMYNVINATRGGNSSAFKGLAQRIKQFLKSQPGTGYADPGHIEQYENLQRNLQKRMDDYRNTGCGEPPSDIKQWVTTPMPDPLPESSPHTFSVPKWVGPAILVTGGVAILVFAPEFAPVLAVAW